MFIRGQLANLYVLVYTTTTERKKKETEYN
jgi:hypothetical protein